MKKIILTLFAAASLFAVNAQEAKTMYVMKNGEVAYQSAVSEIDSIILYAPIVSNDPLTYDEGVVINGIKWATRNVDAPGTFAATPEDPGMFYQWNSKVGWSHSDPLTPSDGTSTWNIGWNGNGSATWKKANDPCPAGWRIPNQGELSSLRSSSVWTTNGCEFGSDSNTIFLPAGGFRDNGTLYNNAGSDGHYWSSTQNYDYNDNAYYMHFDSFNASVYSFWYKSGAYLCRCVEE